MDFPDYISLQKRVLAVNHANFNNLALDIFRVQYEQNPVYQQFCQLIHKQPAFVTSIEQIPFLPITFFKTHAVKTGSFTEEAVFESSGTAGTNTSRHFIKSLAFYRQSFMQGFTSMYGPAGNYCILCLLPSYLQKGNSSLVYMAAELIKQSKNPLSGFYLDELSKLHDTILSREIKKERVLLLGVTYALLDFAEAFPMKLKHTIVMETGGMKGRKKEMIRSEVHDILKKKLGVPQIHSEYGMTELLSQAYSSHDGIYTPSSTLKVLIREEDDPESVTEKPGAGILNIIDLCNIYSCSFIATEDMGRLYPNGRFEITGRLDSSEIRGCSLMII